ncbi:hypothetical protein BX600DRAFT_555957 [Xylariales sp. PMI_506]|nr:hypothetical protein BX600DRAFT_555957 [Xylariales sp. PMI_506]
MAEQPEPEIVLYDLACTKNVCFSPIVWRIRLVLNYKQIPYRTVFVDFPDLEPTLKELGVIPSEAAMRRKYKYTVPVIQHVPTNTYMMDSAPIAQFLESQYPDPPVAVLQSEEARSLEARVDALGDAIFHISVMPREVGILSPRGKEYFRRTREASLGDPQLRLEDLLAGDREERGWEAIDQEVRAVGQLMRQPAAKGPFVLGSASPSYTDFVAVGWLQCARVVDEGVFQRNIAYPGYKEVYEACLPYLERNN